MATPILHVNPQSAASNNPSPEAQHRQCEEDGIVAGVAQKDARSARALARWAVAAGVVVIVLLIFAQAWGIAKLPWATRGDEAAQLPPKEGPGIQKVEGQPYSLLVPDDVPQVAGHPSRVDVDRVAVAVKPTRTAPLVMSGSTALDPARLIRVRVRFAPADVVEIGKIADPHRSPGEVPPPRRDFQMGDAGEEGRPAGGGFQRGRGQQEERPLRRAFAVAVERGGAPAGRGQARRPFPKFSCSMPDATWKPI